MSREIRALMLATLVACFSLGGALLAAAPLKRIMQANPAEAPEMAISSDPAIIKEGQGYFTMSCVECHGDDAHGDEGPDLHKLTISNGRIATTIKKGVKGEMPAFAKQYNDLQVAALTSYLRSLD